MNDDDFIASKEGDFTQSQLCERDFYYAGGFWRSPGFGTLPAPYPYVVRRFDGYPDSPNRPATVNVIQVPNEIIVIPDDYTGLVGSTMDLPGPVGPSPPTFNFTGIPLGSWLRFRIRVWGIMPLVDPWVLPPFEVPASIGIPIYKCHHRLWLTNQNAHSLFDPLYNTNRNGICINAISKEAHGGIDRLGLYDVDRIIIFFGQLSSLASVSMGQVFPAINNGLGENPQFPGTGGDILTIREPNESMTNPRNPIPLEFVPETERSKLEFMYYEPPAFEPYLTAKIYTRHCVAHQIIDALRISEPADKRPEYLDSKIEQVSQIQGT